MSLSEKEAQAVLRAAAEDCSKNWCQSANENEHGQHCMLGAVNAAAGVPVDFYSWADLEGAAKEILAEQEAREGYEPSRSEAKTLVIYEAVKATDPENIELRDLALRKIYSVVGGEFRVDDPDQDTVVHTTYTFNDCSSQDAVVAALRLAATR